MASAVGSVRNLGDFAPSPVTRAVQIDPGDQPVPGLVVQFHCVMPLLQHLDQFAGVGIVLARPQQVRIVLDVHAADVRDQGFVGGRVMGAPPAVRGRHAAAFGKPVRVGFRDRGIEPIGAQLG
jgi:hypothetical protein